MVMNHATNGLIIAAATAIVLIAATNIVPLVQERQAYAASLKEQHSNLLNNCYRSNTCRESNVDTL
jgi:hypothetical protein